MVETYTVEQLVGAADLENADELCDYIYSTMGKPMKTSPTGDKGDFVFKFTFVDETNDRVNIDWWVAAGDSNEDPQFEIPITEDIISLVENSNKY